LSCKENIGTSESEYSVDIVDSCMIAGHSKYVGICTDGSRFTSGCHEDVKFLQAQNILVLFKHTDSMIHRHAFVWKCSMPAMSSAPQTGRNIVKYVKSHCATSQKFAGSISYSVIGIFHWHKTSGRTMAMGSTQPLINEYQGCFQSVKLAVA